MPRAADDPKAVILPLPPLPPATATLMRVILSGVSVRCTHPLHATCILRDTQRLPGAAHNGSGDSLSPAGRACGRLSCFAGPPAFLDENANGGGDPVHDLDPFAQMLDAAVGEGVEPSCWSAAAGVPAGSDAAGCLEAAKGAVDCRPIEPSVGDSHRLRLGGDLVAVRRAEAGEDQQHDGLREAIEVAHLAAAGPPPELLSVVPCLSVLVSHGFYLYVAFTVYHR